MWEWQRGHDAAVSDSKERRVPQRLQNRDAYVSIAAGCKTLQNLLSLSLTHTLFSEKLSLKQHVNVNVNVCLTVYRRITLTKLLTKMSRE